MEQTGVEGIQQDQQSFWMQNVGLTNFFVEQTCATKIIIISYQKGHEMFSKLMYWATKF